MQDRYTADLGDFGKYGLLNALAADADADAPPLTLGVQWYRVPDENHLNDGKFTGYLRRTPANEEQFRACAPKLYDQLSRLVSKGRRTLDAVERDAVLPATTTYFSRPLTYDGLNPARGRRAAHRAQWHADALDTLKRCDLVFLDPDNGLECAVSATASAGPKYALISEAAAFAERGQSLAIYHHIGRRDSARTQVVRQLRRLASACPTSGAPFALRWHRGTSRVYLVVPSIAHAALLRRRALKFLTPPWDRHWSGPYGI